MTLQQIAASIWTVPSPLSIAGLKLNTSATIVRLKDDSLWVHSPVRLNDELRDAVAALGTVRWLIAPCLMHHLFVADWKAAFPQAAILAPEGLKRKRADLEIADSIVQGATWRDEIDVVFLEGFPLNEEHLFFHRASQTLIVTDFCFYNPEASGITGMYLWINRVTRQPNIPLVVKFSIKDKEALAKSLAPTRQWPIQHISFCHHAILSDDAHAQWQRVLDNTGVAAQG